MKSVTVAAFTSVAAAGNLPEPNYNAMWDEFQKKFGKGYLGADEGNTRFEVFKANVDIILATNAKNLSYTLGVNQFADLTADEFAAQYTGLKKPEKIWGDLPYMGRHTYSRAALPDSVDWTTKGAVTPVKNQGQCGSCWSFSTTGSLEGAWKIASGSLVSVSEQQFVDCDHVDQGCNGGLMDNAFKFAKGNALCTEESYSYKARKGTCKASSCAVGIPMGGVTGYKDVANDDEQALKEAVATNPVSIAIEADKSSFQMYKGGVFKANCGTKLDHGVLVVGYGTDGSDYWKVKNSWGSSWGEDGYIRMERGKGGAGECGILSQASYPIVTGKSVPTPPPTPSPPSPPSPPPGNAHYEKPPCGSDEKAVRVQGLPGDFCSPDCTKSACPTDVPADVTAQPQCILQDPSGGKSCALVCDPNDSTNECGAGSCQPIQGTGICTYSSGPSPGPSPPGCADENQDLCKSLIDMDSKSKVCREFSLICKKSCGCCGPSPESWCDNIVTLRTTDSSIVV